MIVKSMQVFCATYIVSSRRSVAMALLCRHFLPDIQWSGARYQCDKLRRPADTESRRWLCSASGRSTYSSVHCRWQSVSCYSRSSVEQSSITRHCCPLSPSSAVVLNHISSHFLIPLSDSSLICTVPAQSLFILDTIKVITFNILIYIGCIESAITGQWVHYQQCAIVRCTYSQWPRCRSCCSYEVSPRSCILHHQTRYTALDVKCSSSSSILLLLLVLCEYSKFRIESNSYLLFDSIRNCHNYSKFSNTYLTVISRAIDVRFVCTLPATSCRTHLSVEPNAAPRVFLPPPLPRVPWPRTARMRGGSSRACMRAPSASLDHDIW